jgi:predicted nucleic acid-binding protein
VDYLLDRHVGERAAQGFRADLATGAFAVEWGTDADAARAHELCTRYADLELGLVDAVVAAVAERLHARSIATFDRRDFAPLVLRGSPTLLPDDAGRAKRGYRGGNKK